MSCKNHFIWDNKCEYCGRPACELGKRDHYIWDNKCEYCGIPSCEVGNKNYSNWNRKCECCRRRCTCESESPKKNEDEGQNYRNDCKVF